MCNNNHQSKNKIQFTIHSRERGYERIGITNKNELRDMVANARFKGNNINSIDIYNYEKLGLTYGELVSIKRRFNQRSNSDRLYYYKGYVFIFFGKDSMSLKTIIKLNIDEDSKNICQPIFN